MAFSVEKMSHLYLQQLVRLHRVPISIVMDRDSQFTASFWESLQDAMGTSLSLDSAFHPQIERVNQVMEDMLRACVLKFKGS